MDAAGNSVCAEEEIDRRLLGLCVLREKPSGLVSRPARSTSSPADRLQTKSRLEMKQSRGNVTGWMKEVS